MSLLDLARSALTHRGAEDAPRYRWLITEHDGRRREVSCLPKMSRAELAPRYPGARLLPLPDAAAEAARILNQHAHERETMET